MNPIQLKETQMPSGASELAEQLAALREAQEDCANELLHNIQQHLPDLEKLFARIEDHWGIEDSFYRFYHQSFKVYYLQQTTEEICKDLQNLLPRRPLNCWFTEIVTQGTGHEFKNSHNKEWLRHTRPILEAFFHAHFFLKMAIKYGKELKTAPNCLPSGWAAVLYLFDLR